MNNNSSAQFSWNKDYDPLCENHSLWTVTGVYVVIFSEEFIGSAKLYLSCDIVVNAWHKWPLSWSWLHWKSFMASAKATKAKGKTTRGKALLSKIYIGARRWMFYSILHHRKSAWRTFYGSIIAAEMQNKIFFPQKTSPTPWFIEKHCY